MSRIVFGKILKVIKDKLAHHRSLSSRLVRQKPPSEGRLLGREGEEKLTRFFVAVNRFVFTLIPLAGATRFFCIPAASFACIVVCPAAF